MEENKQSNFEMKPEIDLAINLAIQPIHSGI